MDLIYPLRPGNTNEELKFSLRTVEAHYPQHGNIWIIGNKPTWLRDVNFIPGNNQTRGVMWNVRVYRNILTACEHDDTPDQFIAMNDDFLITAPITDIPVYHRGSLRKQVECIKDNPRTWWHHSLLFTLETLEQAGYPDPISYEVHVPLRVDDKQGMAEALRKFDGVIRKRIPVQWRTIYGNLNHIGGTWHQDPKARRAGPIYKPFHSTTDTVWKDYRDHFQQHFPHPSRYEKQQ